ncbi:aminotransferase class III-fold pyridoxal phosphate-dependent enzyme, partial [Nonomuraea sp. NPDC055795]
SPPKPSMAYRAHAQVEGLGGRVGDHPDPGQPGRAGLSTFGGNPISMAAANATLDYVLDHDLQANAARTGAHIIDGLRAAAERLPIVTGVRGKGLMFAIELAEPAMTGRFMELTKQAGLLAGKGGLYGTAIRMAPPLTLTMDEAAEGLGIIVDALETINDEVR